MPCCMAKLEHMAPGWAVSGFYGYLKGVSNELALRHVADIEPRRDTLAGPLGRRGDQARLDRALPALNLNMVLLAMRTCCGTLHMHVMIANT